MANIIEVIVKGNAGSALNALGAVEAKAKTLAIAGAAITGPLLLAVRSLQTYGEELDRASKITGIQIEKLAALRFAVEQEHGSFDALIAATRRWSKAMVELSDPTSQQSKLVKELGLNADELRRLPFDQALLKFAAALRTVENDTTKVALAQEFLGRGARELLPFLKQSASETQKSMEMAKQLGLVISTDTAKAAEEFGDRLGELRGALRGVSLTVGAALLPVVRQLVIDIAKVIMKITAWIKEHPQLTLNILKVVGALGIMLTAIGAIGVAASTVGTGLKALNVLVLAARNPWLLLAAAIGIAIFKFMEWDEINRKAEAIRAKLVEPMKPGMPEGIIRTPTGVRRLTPEEIASAEATKMAKANMSEIEKILASGAGAAKKQREAIEGIIESLDREHRRRQSLLELVFDEAAKIKALVTEQQKYIGELKNALVTTAMSKEAKASLISKIKDEIVNLEILAARVKHYAESLERANAEEIRSAQQQRQLDRYAAIGKEIDRINKALHDAAVAGDIDKVDEILNRFGGVVDVDIASGARKLAESNRQIAQDSAILKEVISVFERFDWDDHLPKPEQVESFDQLARTVDDTLLALQRRRELGLLTVEEERAALDKLIKMYEALPSLTDEQTKALERLRHEAAKISVEVVQRMKLDKAVESVVSGITNAFQNLFMGLLFEGKSAGEALLDFFKNVGRSILQEVTKAVAESIVESLRIKETIKSVFSGSGIFGGGGPGGGGILAAILGMAGLFFRHGGIIPGHLVPITAAAGGGIFKSPTLAMIAEGGDEAAIPLKNGKVPVEMRGGGRGSFVANIYAWDTATGMDQLYQHRDFILDLVGAGGQTNHPASRRR